MQLPSVRYALHHLDSNENNKELLHAYFMLPIKTAITKGIRLYKKQFLNSLESFVEERKTEVNASGEIVDSETITISGEDTKLLSYNKYIKEKKFNIVEVLFIKGELDILHTFTLNLFSLKSSSPRQSKH